MNWNRWVLAGYLALGVGLLVFEFIGLRHKDDNWPTITTLVMTAIKSKWWAAAMIFGFLAWLIVHFAKRIR